jgi:arabinan endo-1,5-alpha-L-arabinosidase
VPVAVAISGCADNPSPNADAVGVYGNCADGDVACGSGGQAAPIPDVTDPGTGGNATAGASSEEMAPDIVGIGVMNPAQGTGGAAAGGGQGGEASIPPLVGCDVGVADPSNPPQALTLSGNLGAHDPVIIAAHDQYYYFSTGGGVAAKVSPDLLTWSNQPAVFPTTPAWFQQLVPAYQPRNTWAPDISYFGGQYHLYYSVSSFGSNRSCIGHATRPALNTGTWTDLEDVFCSNQPGQNDNYNAIDPNVILDDAGTPWMSFGSFWDGIKMIQLDLNGDRAGTDLYDLASRGGGSIEAPFIVQRCGYYYLFVSFGACCDGVDSTYNIRVGRSRELLGPYVAKDGTPMLDGGGTLVLEEGGDWVGPGHNAILIEGTRAYNVYHAYAATNGASQLRISELVWDSEDWPLSGGP